MTTENLKFIPFHSPLDKGWDEAWAIYMSSFPFNERRSEAYTWEAVEDPLFSADGIWIDDKFVGIIFHWDAGDLQYVEHLAIKPEFRGQDMGSKALSAFCKDRKRVILEIDPPVDDISNRRLRFYQRLGFKENSYEYIHPSFCRPFLSHKLVLMSWPELVNDERACVFEVFVKDRVLKYSDHSK